MTSTSIPQLHDASNDLVWRQAQIDLSAITHNVQMLKRLAGVDEFIAVVKADGYGHGSVEAAHAAIRGGATRIGVADLSEAVHLVMSGVSQVPVLAWLHPPDADFVGALAAGVEIGVSTISQLESIAQQRSSDTVPRVHLKVETGLGRGGAAPRTWESFMATAAHLEQAGVLEVIGIFSHLSGASKQDDLQQLEVFKKAVATAEDLELRPSLVHLAATAATISLPETRLNTVRVGLGIYGLSPFENTTSAQLGLRPAMSLQAPVIAIRDVEAGQGVSYGYDFKTETPTRLALIPLGYADGIPRQASGKSWVAIDGQPHPVVGRIAMDQFVVDVADNPVQVGDIVTVFGSAVGEPSADHWAVAADTINYTVVTGIGRRVVRTYVTSYSDAK